MLRSSIDARSAARAALTSAAAFASILTCVCGVGAETGRRPNIVLLVADDLGYAELGCQGATDIATPRIDALAAAGVRFTSAYVTASVCTPSRAGFLTGRYQQRFGHELNATQELNDDPSIGLPTQERTLADHLKNSGYATGIVGKWHLGTGADRHPMRRGFDEFFGFLREGHYFVPPPYDGVYSRFRDKEPSYDRLNPILRGTQEVVEPEYLTKAFTREAVDFIDRHHDQPFFLYLPYNAVHSPMQARLADVERFDGLDRAHRAIFAGMLWAMDESVGAVLDALDRHGLTGDTLVIFISDNGGPTAELTSRNDPLSGGKGSLLEGGVRVPMIATWPDHLPAAKVCDKPVSSLDIVPTTLAAARVDASALSTAGPLDGVDLTPYLTGARSEPPHDVLYWRMGGKQAIRQGDWKLVRTLGSPPQLFDLAADMGETRDLSADHPQVVADLLAAYVQWESGTIEPLWGAPAPRRAKGARK